MYRVLTEGLIILTKIFKQFLNKKTTLLLKIRHSGNSFQLTRRGKSEHLSYHPAIGKFQGDIKMPETILIVDDDRGVRYSLKRMFEEKGMQTLIARNGREALELLKQGITPDVALIDIVMPG
jgi:PleD family two-component response regulator